MQRQLPPDAGEPAKARLYLVVIAFLGVALLGGIGSIVFLTAIDKDVPEAMGVLASTAGGALVGALVPRPD